MGRNPLTHERGEIYNRILASQIRDFSGLRIKNITPTDLDGYIEYQNKAWILFELKGEGAELPFGQRLALERMVDDLSKTGKYSIGFVAEHKDIPPDDIDAKEAIIKEYRHLNEWHPCENGTTLYKAIIGFLKKNLDFTT